jgi:D-amino-acid dehydrogenase
MRVAVLGAGVIGVTTAYYLARAGHEVTLVDRQAGPGLETSFANAGEISPGYASPWAAPDVPKKALMWLFMEHAPLIVRPKLDWAMLCWLFATMRNCTASAYAINKRRMVRLAEYSRDQLAELRAETGVSYDERMRGTLQLFRTPAEFDGIAKDVEVLQRDLVPFEVLDRQGCIAAEPGLAAATQTFVGGLRLPRDETGDCYKFTAALADLAAKAGVKMRFGERIEHFQLTGGRIEAVKTNLGALRADRFVVALGSHSPQVVAPLGLRLPVYPVKGYSITAPIRAAELAPVSTVLDERFKVAITRLGDRIRVGGMAELSGYELGLPRRRRETLVHSAAGLFPDTADWGRAEFWAGLRPMTPDSAPIVGATGIANLYLNTGHGTLGWTMACGSARVLSDIISGVEPEIETADLGLRRYSAVTTRANANQRLAAPPRPRTMASAPAF